MKKLLLKNWFSPGDLVMLSAAIRDLHRTYPKQFLTDVRTPCPDLWLHNPYLTPLREDDPEVEMISCDYPLINQSDRAPYHCLHGFIDFLNDHLGLRIRPTEYKGDIHLSAQEKAWFSQVHELTGEDTPFWIIVAGGKYDVTIKWWDAGRFQEVVDSFRGRIQFVQVGEAGHYHPRLEGVIDLRGRTNLRQLVRLVYHAQGVLCPVTALMHLAAAVEVKPGYPDRRPCVVIAGGREPAHWEAYPGHQLLHTIGALPCCATAGCWKARTVALGDGDERDRPDRLCVNVVGALPRCMDMISAGEVIRRIELYFQGGAVKYLSKEQAAQAARGMGATRHNPLDDLPLTVHTARRAVENFIEAIPVYRGTDHGRGIVICAGGVKYFTPAWVCVNLLRRLGCTLPIQLWHLGQRELSAPMRALVEPLEVTCVDALKIRQSYPARLLHGWPLKPYAILHAPFKEVLLLDADNVPVVNPEFLFETGPFRETGAVFWPDGEGSVVDQKILDICGVASERFRPVESGQILVDKARCWRALCLTMWCNEHADFFYEFMHGDTATYPLAFRKLNQEFVMPATPMQRLSGTICQHDFAGHRIFQHRSDDKWNLFCTNRRLPDFWLQDECFQLLRQLRERWDGRIGELKGEWAAGCRKDGPLSDPEAAGEMGAFILSIPGRGAFCRRTEEKLRATDWGSRCISGVVGTGDPEDASACLDEAGSKALTLALEAALDYALLFADDLEFSPFLAHNLRHWAPLRRRQIAVASLFNAGIPPVACHVHENYFVAESDPVFGSTCFLISRAAARFLLDHWSEIKAPPGLKIPYLAAQMRQPIFYHAPSLVEHAGKEMFWGGRWPRACDFNPQWQAGG